VSYRVILLSGAQRDLRALPLVVQKRIIARPEFLAGDPRSPDTEPLHGVLRGWRKARVGNYRIGYQVDDPAEVIRVRAIGHRHKVYQEMIRRM
jgi:mRNA interferase RelE/StbE